MGQGAHGHYKVAVHSASCTCEHYAKLDSHVASIPFHVLVTCVRHIVARLGSVMIVLTRPIRMLVRL
jgi:hypothetical protein